MLKSGKKDSSNIASQTLQIEKFSPLTRQPRLDFDDGDGVEEADDIAGIEKKIKVAEMPDHARKVAMKELQRLKKMPIHMPEHAMTRSYLELMTDLPWNKMSPERIDLKRSREALDSDHYGLDKLKKRVLEYLAVRQLRNNLKGPILCFVGPPGVGKTSVGKSIANSLGREFHRISLGGVCDQSDIRGHRRTYIGSMPGRIIQGLKNVNVKNPVFLLDEIDKMSQGIHGDPSAAMLEVLDPEQNCNFTDHYLNVPFDLSQVLFIATANTTSTIPAALLDRMEIISVPGYTHDEKYHIATFHLIPKQLKEHGLSEDVLVITGSAIRTLVSKYTREAGVRNLERRIGAICRSTAVKVVERNRDEGHNEGKSSSESNDVDRPQSNLITLSPSSESVIIVDEVDLEAILGPPLFDNEIAARVGMPGVAIGLAWTASGGEVMFVEATKMEGGGQLILTGQLGDVMQESAKIALNWLRSHVIHYGISIVNATDIMENTDVHIHFPAGLYPPFFCPLLLLSSALLSSALLSFAPLFCSSLAVILKPPCSETGAVGKDGPSAGVTIVTALVSLFTGRIVSPDTAMTGEMTLRGLVLPVSFPEIKVLSLKSTVCVSRLVESKVKYWLLIGAEFEESSFRKETRKICKKFPIPFR